MLEVTGLDWVGGRSMVDGRWQMVDGQADWWIGGLVVDWWWIDRLPL